MATQRRPIGAPDPYVGGYPIDPNTGQPDPSRGLGADPYKRAPGGDSASARGDVFHDTLGSIWRLSPRQRQAVLHHLGFNVKVDGKAGPQTAAAAWAYTHGHSAKWYNNKGRDWQQAIWNQHFANDPQSAGTTPATSKPSGPGKPVDKNNTVAPQASDAQFSTAGTAGALAVLGDSDALVGDVNTGQFINAGDARVGKLVDRMKVGAAAREQGFGASIRSLERDVTRLPKQGAQNQRDLTNWYDDIDKTLGTAAAANAAAGDAAIEGVQNYGKSVAQAIGGEANPGAADVGAVGEAEAANLRALKLIGSQTATEMGSAIGAEGLSARTRQKGLDSQALADAKNKLVDTQAQAGAAESAAQLEADQYNNQVGQQNFQNVTDIKKFNTGVDQQRFQNKVAAAQARIAALASIPDLALKGAEATFALNNPAAAFGSSSAAAKGPKGTWAGTDAKVKGQVADLANQTILGLANSGADAATIVRSINNIYKSRGWSLRNKNVVNAIRANLEGAGVKTNPKWWGGYGYKG